MKPELDAIAAQVELIAFHLTIIKRRLEQYDESRIVERLSMEKRHLLHTSRMIKAAADKPPTRSPLKDAA